jgi:S-adenosylmethionine-dependent methyltransferase
VTTPFTAGERNWQARLGKLRDVVRQELVARQLARELPAPPVRVLDCGCGQGTQLLRLARRSYQVTGVEASADLLARLEQDLAALLDCEERAASTDPCRQVAALLHVLARRAG